MRSVTQLKKANKDKVKYHKRVEEEGDGTNTITFSQYKEILKESKRVCKDLAEFEQHANHIYNYGSKARCVMCGEFCYKRCGICGLPMYHADTKGSNKGKNCAIQWHNKTYLGLAFDDCKFMKKNKKDWKAPLKSLVKRNGRIMKRYREACTRR